MTDQSVTDRKYDAILDDARMVSSREGYAESSIEDVAAQGGIGKGTVYLYFKSKEELFVAALERVSGMFTSKAREEMETVPAFREKIEAFLRVCAWSIAAHTKTSCAFMFSEYGSICECFVVVVPEK
jgi:AcrR family transcriptional regulator